MAFFMSVILLEPLQELHTQLVGLRTVHCNRFQPQEKEKNADLETVVNNRRKV